MDKLKILSDTENYLKNSLDKLKEVKIVDLQSLKLNSLQYRNAGEASLNLKMLRKSSNPIIYVIELETKNIIKELLSNFDEFTTYNIQKTKNKDRVNISRDMKRDSHVLYVGSSTTDFKSRIKNHLGVRGNRVYSLHLCKWDKDLNYNIIIKSYEIVSRDEAVIDRYLVEVIEQQIWDLLQPNFGKRSGL